MKVSGGGRTCEVLNIQGNRLEGRWAWNCTFQDKSRWDKVSDGVWYLDFVKESLSPGDCEIWERRFNRVQLD